MKLSGFLVFAALVLGRLPAATTDWDVRDFGAMGDGHTLATAAIQRAVDACAAAGGGRVVVPAGTFVSGPIFLKSYVDFHLSPGAVLAGSQDFADYPVIAGRDNGIERPIHASLITAIDAVEVSVTGSGTIDGRGEPWWVADLVVEKMRKQHGITAREPDNPPGSPLRYPRPRAIYLHHCRKVRLSGVTVTNSPSWTVHPVYCEDVVIDGLTITAPANSHNTDGIDPDSCRDVRIANCRISSADDGIIIKSGYNADGRRVGRPCENIVITNCTIGPAIAAVGIGSETAGGIRNVTVTNCVFDGTRDGLRVKSARGRGAVVENFRASNLVMRRIGSVALAITTYYDSEDHTPRPVDETTPTLRNIEWSHLTIDGAAVLAQMEGLPEKFLQGVTLDHITVRNAQRGLSVLYADGLRIEECDLDVAAGPALSVVSCQQVELVGLKGRTRAPAAPLVLLKDVTAAWVRACWPASGTGEFLRVSGAGSREIVLQGNLLTHAAQPVVTSDGAPAVKILP